MIHFISMNESQNFNDLSWNNSLFEKPNKLTNFNITLHRTELKG